MLKISPLITAACLLCCLSRDCPCYSVFTHEQLIDLSWKSTLEPLLRRRFSGTTDDQLRQAHAYAYGGCAIQDLGYYPFGNQFFSDLTHYVRTGGFVMNLLRDARNVDEYAFALGAMSHYLGDTVGHHEAVNPATALSFPKLERKYGPVIIYGQAPHAHVRTEFAFDIDQLSQQHLAPDAYLRFIGFRVPIRLLAQAFDETYSLSLDSVLHARRPAVRSYRGSVRSFLPRIAHAESVIHRNDFPADYPDNAFETFLNAIEHEDFQKVWNKYRRQPGFKTQLLAFLIRIVPKIGVLSDLAIAIPTQQTEDLYIKSVNRATKEYDGLLHTVDKTPTVLIPDVDLDTGEEVKPGADVKADETFAELLHRIAASGPPHKLRRALREELIAYYANPPSALRSSENTRAWSRISHDLELLRVMQEAP